MAATKEKKHDPITDVSMAKEFLICSGILFLTMVWGAYDEIWVRRPWKAVQMEFKEIAGAKYDEDLEQARRVLQSPGYRSAQSDVDKAKAAFDAHPEVKRIKQALEQNAKDYDEVRKKFQVLRGDLQEAQYFWEQARTDLTEQNRIAERIKQLEEGDPAKNHTGTNTLSRKMTEFDLRKKELKSELIVQRKELDAAERKVGHLVAPISRIEGQKASVENSRIEVRQVVNDQLGLVDRCENCHVAARLDGFPKGERFPHPFASHPGSFLEHHNIDAIGCATCHRGQPYANSNPDEGHGWDKYWLEPMLPAVDSQALCFKCHDEQTVVPEGDRVSRGRQLIQDLGCWGCHKIRGFDREEIRLSDARLARDQGSDALASAREQAAKAANDPRLLARVEELEGGMRRAQKSWDEAAKEFRQVGPDLTRIKSKVYPGWIEVWISHPKGWRDTTTMPNSRLLERDDNGVNEIQAIAAYLWQNSDGPTLARHPLEAPPEVKAKAEEGKNLFETVGCVACHSIKVKGADGTWARQGGEFAPDLSKVGEKITYEYLVEWVLTPKKFQPHGRMPTLRLTRDQAEKVAAYLTTLQIKVHDTEPLIPKRDLGYLEDLSLAELGRKKIQRYGCFSCHDIKGFENAGKIAVELTAVYAKLPHQFDFGLLEHEIKEKYKIHDKHDWHSHLKRIWVREKIKDPRQWDHGRDLTKKGDDRLRMPDFELSWEQIDDIVCFVQSLDGKEFPLAYRYRPRWPKDGVIEGEKLVRKYNCSGCHMFEVNKLTLKNGAVVHGLPTTQSETDLYVQLHADSPELGKWTAETAKIPLADIVDNQKPWGGDIMPHLTRALVEQEVIGDEMEAPPQMPPLLRLEGLKVQSPWVFQFLKEPYPLRPWLATKMPTFELSDGEAQALARYFAARNGEEFPFEFNLEKHRQYLDEQEKAHPGRLAKAQALFERFECQKCHVKGKQTPKGDSSNWAPDLLMSKERLRPEWLVKWLTNPKKMLPGTKMPQFQWGTEQEAFPGPAEEQVQGIKDLLQDPSGGAGS